MCNVFVCGTTPPRKIFDVSRSNLQFIAILGSDNISILRIIYPIQFRYHQFVKTSPWKRVVQKLETHRCGATNKDEKGGAHSNTCIEGTMYFTYPGDNRERSKRCGGYHLTSTVEVLEGYHTLLTIRMEVFDLGAVVLASHTKKNMSYNHFHKLVRA